MSLTAIVVCLALQAGPLAPEPVEAAEPSRAAFTFDTLPAPPTVSDDVRVKRVSGALAGGIVGFAAGLALMPLGDPTCGPFFPGGSCVNAIHVSFGVLAPVLAATGAWAGFQLMGGEGGWATALGGFVPAGLLGFWLLSVARDMDAATSVQLLPFAAGAGLLLAGSATLILELRARQLESLGAAAERGSATGGRVALTALGSAVALGPAGALTVLLLAGAVTGAPALWPLVVLAGVGGMLATGAATWGLHRALGGRGTFGAAMVGLAVGSTVALAAGVLFALTQGGFRFSAERSTASAALFLELSAVAAMFAPVFALELSHTASIGQALPKVTVGAAPVKDGGMVAATMRF